MKYISTIIYHLPSGGFKAYVWGQPQYHIMDWNGCNYRKASVKDQPRRGFKTIKECSDFIKEKFPHEFDAIKYAEDIGDGSHFGDNDHQEWASIRWEKNGISVGKGLEYTEEKENG